MECLIDCTDSEEKLTKLNSLPLWETLLNAAGIRKFEPILKMLEKTEPDISSVFQTGLGHQFNLNSTSKKNLYHETFLVNFNLF